jgi:hypothetical protein
MCITEETAVTDCHFSLLIQNAHWRARVFDCNKLVNVGLALAQSRLGSVMPQPVRNQA